MFAICSSVICPSVSFQLFSLTIASIPPQLLRPQLAELNTSIIFTDDNLLLHFLDTAVASGDLVCMYSDALLYCKLYAHTNKKEILIVSCVAYKIFTSFVQSFVGCGYNLFLKNRNACYVRHLISYLNGT